MRCGERSRERGFTYLGVLFAVALIGIGIGATSEVWVTTARREQLQQLDWVGRQYVQAIGSYYSAGLGRVRSYPPSLDAMLEDSRFVLARRHLRSLYPNPLTGKMDWILIRASDGGIRGLEIRDESEATGGQQTRRFVFVPAF